MRKPPQIRAVPERALEVLTSHAPSKTMSEVLAGPRLRKGRALKTEDILEALASGRR
jgi:hypothetical protein